MTGGDVGVPSMTFGFCGTAIFTTEPLRTRAGTGGGGETCLSTGLEGGVTGKFRMELTAGTRNVSFEVARGYNLGLFPSALAVSRTHGGDFSSVLTLWLTSTCRSVERSGNCKGKRKPIGELP
jgi:hypothetical protein